MNRFVGDIAWPRGDTKSVFEYFSTPMKQNHFTFAAKGAIYYVTITTVIFQLHVICFRLKTLLLFHKCLYNNVYSFTTNDWITFYHREQLQN